MLDTNAVLDLYRFTDTTREEYLAALELLGERLWIPNRVGEEFHDRRTTVIADRQGIRNVIADQVAKPIGDLMAIAERHAQRHGLDGDSAAAAVRDGVNAALDPVIGEIEGTVGGITIDLNAHPDSDPILSQLNELFDRKNGAAFSDKDAAAAQKEHSIRMAGHVPPGYADASKGERAIGDFLVWKQTIIEATKRGLPVLLITNETKPDWVFRDGPYTMPRVELVREMKQKAGCDFHLVDVQTYLSLAEKYLAAQVSEAAVDEAARITELAEQSVAAGPNWPLMGLDPGAEWRRTLASIDQVAEVRRILESTGFFDPSAGLRKVYAPAPKAPHTPRKKAASAAKPKATKKRAAGDKAAE
ncbi:PIN-like domain-containing protein [Nocardia fluminea]